MNKNNKPKHFLVLKIIGIIGVLMFVYGINLATTSYGDFESNNFMIASFLICFGLFIGGAGLSLGFIPEIHKANTRTIKYIQETNKEDLKDIAINEAEIREEAITKTTRAVKKGLKSETVFCKYCGAEIDGDSVFCKKCGKEQ